MLVKLIKPQHSETLVKLDSPYRRPVHPGVTEDEWRARQRRDSEALVWRTLQWILVATVLAGIAWVLSL